MNYLIRMLLILGSTFGLSANSFSGTPYYTDNFDGSNDTTSLKARGYKVYYRGTGTQGAATWFQGSESYFPAFNGPVTGYVAAHYSTATNTNNIDNWLVLPKIH